ncbi:nuclear envelope pore membrane protein POM 121 isoform X2 [Nelusetta ayraudi]|uniref:nuclear envelope pore membrane protein POM 121 isoform X2 n=1 Tax=Nelusetta ayraudi TaxID=303726 RepID=UPI003F7201FF
MRVLRRRVAAMSPREKRLAILSALCVVCFSLYYIPTFFCLTLFLVFVCILCYYYNGAPLPASLGPNPRTGFAVPAGLRRWFPGWVSTGVSAATQGRNKSSRNRAELRQTDGHFRGGVGEARIYRKETLQNDSFLFSPRDLLMGSYIGKPESPPADSVRPRAGRNPREQLREKLTRPNHAVYTPNRRLSFAVEPAGAACRFTITPLRHYPLQQPGVSSVGVLPPAKWDSFRKKNVLSPRNSPAALSPVTVKIARPDHHHSSPSVDHFSCAEVPRAPLDPCSRESVLKVLKESRKRDVDDEDRIFTTEQRSKRRRNDSGGSAHSAFGPLLPNGTPSQLVPKPGNLKRGMTSLVDESTMKRSRTSSISSVSGAHAPRGTPGTARNPIHSSYSSSGGISQFRKRIAPSPSLSSPGSPRSQTPEAASKKSREDEGQSPSSSSSVRSDQAASENAPVTSKLTPVPKLPVLLSSDSPASGGKRKRKIQLVSSHGDNQISLPPPPELGYAITAKDLDEEKKAAINKIQKILETPDPEPEKTAPSPDIAASRPPPTTTLSSLLAAPLPTTSSSTIPVINLDPSPSKATVAPSAASNPLLEALKMKTSVPVSSTPAAATTTAAPASTTLTQPSGLQLTVSTAASPATSHPQTSSAFAQALAQVSKAPAGAPSAAILFGAASQAGTPSASAAPGSGPAAAPVSSSNPLLASGFKPIFAVTPTPTASTPQESKPAPTVSSSSTPLFGGLLAGSTTVTLAGFPAASTAANGITTASSSAATTTAQIAAQPTIKSLFGNWSAPSTTSTGSPAAPAPATQSTLQFGATATTAAAAAGSAAAPITTPAPAATTASNGTFTFGAAKPDTQTANQKVFAFGQAGLSQSTTTASFGGFAMTSTASTTAAPSNQPISTLGKTMFQAPAPQATFGSSTAPQATFGSSNAPQATFGSSTAPQTTFGSSTAPQATFGSSTAPQSTFGSSTAPQSTFGSSTAPQATFGSSTAPQATFGSSTAPQATFGSSTAPQTTFGSSTAPQTTFGSSTAPQATFGSSTAPQTTFGSSTTTQANFGSSTAPQATFGSSTAPQANFGSSTAPQATFGSSTTTQANFGSSTAPQANFGSSTAPQATFGSSTAPQATFGSSTAQPAKTFTFGGSGASSAPVSNTTPSPFTFGAAAATTASTFGTSAKPSFGGGSTGFAFGGTAAPSAAPNFGASSQTPSSTPATFAFGGGAAQQVPSAAAKSAPGGFAFGAAVPQFGTPVSNNPAPQMGNFNFGAAAADKPAFGTSTPAFGQSTPGPIPFGSPGTPVQGFNSVPFGGSPATPSFSIGAGSKPSGTRQRLQARRQHNRKK